MNTKFAKEKEEEDNNDIYDEKGEQLRRVQELININKVWK